jgi:hypothetical protein
LKNALELPPSPPVDESATERTAEEIHKRLSHGTGAKQPAARADGTTKQPRARADRKQSGSADQNRSVLTSSQHRRLATSAVLAVALASSVAAAAQLRVAGAAAAFVAVAATDGAQEFECWREAQKRALKESLAEMSGKGRTTEQATEQSNGFRVRSNGAHTALTKRCCPVHRRCSELQPKRDGSAAVAPTA